MCGAFLEECLLVLGQPWHVYHTQHLQPLNFVVKSLPPNANFQVDHTHTGLSFVIINLEVHIDV